MIQKKILYHEQLVQIQPILGKILTDHDIWDILQDQHQQHQRSVKMGDAGASSLATTSMSSY